MVKYGEKETEGDIDRGKEWIQMDRLRLLPPVMRDGALWGSLSKIER